MSLDEALSELRHGWVTKPAAILAWAAALMIKRPEDIPTIKTILKALHEIPN